MVSRVVTGARYGLIDWLIQRITAVVMAIYIILIIALLFKISPQDYTSWKTMFSNQWMRIFTFLAFLSLCWHAWIGLRNILMDYIHKTNIRLILQVLVVLSLFFYAIWAIEIMWG
ncbi:MAG: succinate dehydrogenase, hydrophobic membrane anchor protein [Nitrosomonadaceae bacterium]|nr:succinate dehydrogenase, hydrophobic membrane anchor protein [Nitrosomonadaceae bacterium]|tara:strand:- start:576 stop:920 length:345 start_codon:yes stop_codon:yes gene_type:complete